MQNPHGKLTSFYVQRCANEEGPRALESGSHQKERKLRQIFEIFCIYQHEKWLPDVVVPRIELVDFNKLQPEQFLINRQSSSDHSVCREVLLNGLLVHTESALQIHLSIETAYTQHFRVIQSERFVHWSLFGSHCVLFCQSHLLAIHY